MIPPGHRRPAALAALAAVVLPLSALAEHPFRILVREKGSGWPVPLVELRTTHQNIFVTDNAGLVAFDLPELMGEEIWLGVRSHGYEVAPDGFGYRGVRVRPRPGESITIDVERTLIAKRLGRLTGAGLFAESQKLGQELDWKESGIVGCDSVQNAVHRGRLFWAWGDTTLARYPLGIFHMTAATTALQPLSSFEPPVRPLFEYVTGDDGRPRGVAELPGPGPTWLSGFVSLTDQHRSPRLVATYAKITPPLEAYERGLCVWDEQTARFVPERVLWKKEDGGKPPALPDGHPVPWTDPDGRAWILFGDPFPMLRCPATFEAWKDPARWESLEAQASLTSANGERKLVPHRGSIAWNAFRQRWVTVFMERFGDPSAFGELWYAEARSPLGPWGKAVKVLSHENYTFYNPRLHPEFTAPDSPILLFEGTYTMMFADRANPTPRYDYNQILYRLDLNDPALAAAQE